jgi:alcohol dehydrogenase class IV
MRHLIDEVRVKGLWVAGKLIAFPVPFTFIGPDSSLALCREIAESGVSRLLIITDGVLVELGLVAPIQAALEQGGVAVEVFDEVEPDPTYDQILRGVDRLRASGAGAVLAVGGGSSIDAAKAIIACHSNDCGPEKLVGLFKVWRWGMKLYAIPTTAGTGSEVTVAAVVSDPRAQAKYAIIDPKLVPSMVALDARLMTGLPPALTAATGMDALTHAVESYVSTIATAESKDLSLAAASNLVRNLPLAYRDGRNLAVRECLAIGSSLAGLAFTRVSVGYVHAIAHQLGGLYHVPHGLANAIVMPHVLDVSRDACAGRLADLARRCRIGAAGAPDEVLSRAFIDHLRAMNQEMGIPQTVKHTRSNPGTGGPRDAAPRPWRSSRTGAGQRLPGPVLLRLVRGLRLRFRLAALREASRTVRASGPGGPLQAQADVRRREGVPRATLRRGAGRQCRHRVPRLPAVGPAHPGHALLHASIGELPGERPPLHHPGLEEPLLRAR